MRLFAIVELDDVGWASEQTAVIAGSAQRFERALQRRLQAVKADLDTAKDWSSRAMGQRKINEAKKSQGPGGITMGDNGELK